MGTADARDRGRKSFTRQAWEEAYARLSAADSEVPLEPEDLDRLATAAFLIVTAPSLKRSGRVRTTGF